MGDGGSCRAEPSRPVAGGALDLRRPVQRSLRLALCVTEDLEVRSFWMTRAYMQRRAFSERERQGSWTQRSGWHVCQPRSTGDGGDAVLGAWWGLLLPGALWEPSPAIMASSPQSPERTRLCCYCGPRTLAQPQAPPGTVSVSGTGRFWAGVQSAGGCWSLCDGISVTPVGILLPL